jgi:hypothetical protein
VINLRHFAIQHKTQVVQNDMVFTVLEITVKIMGNPSRPECPCAGA